MTAYREGIIRWALGLDLYGKPHRNAYPAGPGGYLWPEVLELEAQGLLERGRETEEGLIIFRVTAAGKRAVGVPA